jgi:2-C-methyl-D-erythritol 4-phosphate cytidylyltransferase
MNVGVIILSAGKGKRMRLAQNKMLHELDGKPVLIHTVVRLKAVREIRRCTLVVAEDERSQIEHLLGAFGLDVDEIVIGGEERQDSVHRGLLAWKMNKPPDIALIHDGARPFVEVQDIRALLSKVRETKAAVLGHPVKDTMKRVDERGVIVETLPRAELWAVQTPQGFAFPLLFEAYQRAAEQGIAATDDASLVERLGVPVSIVQGHEHNIKLTTPEDLSFALHLLHQNQNGEQSKP